MKSNKLTRKLPNGRLKVNKENVIREIRRRRRMKQTLMDMEVPPYVPVVTDDVIDELSRLETNLGPVPDYD